MQAVVTVLVFWALDGLERLYWWQIRHCDDWGSFSTETDIGVLFFSWLPMISPTSCKLAIGITITIIANKWCTTINGIYCQHYVFRDLAQVTDRSLTFSVCSVCIPETVHNLQDYHLGNTARWWQYPHLMKLQISETGLRVTQLRSLWEMLQHLLMVKYVWVWIHSLSQNIQLVVGCGFIV